MKVLVVLALTGIFSTSALASTYRCNVSAEGDYAVEFNLRAGKAAFFDNDSWAIVDYGTRQSGTMTFSGFDNAGEPLSMSFDFSEMNPQHMVTFQHEDVQVSSRLNCEYSADLKSGIANSTLQNEEDSVLYHCTRELDIRKHRGKVYVVTFDGKREELVETVYPNTLESENYTLRQLETGKAQLLSIATGEAIICVAP